MCFRPQVQPGRGHLNTHPPSWLCQTGERSRVMFSFGAHFAQVELTFLRRKIMRESREMRRGMIPAAAAPYASYRLLRRPPRAWEEAARCCWFARGRSGTWPAIAMLLLRGRPPRASIRPEGHAGEVGMNERVRGGGDGLKRPVEVVLRPSKRNLLVRPSGGKLFCSLDVPLPQITGLQPCQYRSSGTGGVSRSRY